MKRSLIAMLYYSYRNLGSKKPNRLHDEIRVNIFTPIISRIQLNGIVTIGQNSLIRKLSLYAYPV